MSKFNNFLKTTLLFLVVIYISPTIISHIKKQWSYKLETHNKIGYISIHGNISNTSFYRMQLANYFKDASIKAILIKIESDSGATGSCQALAYDIENFKKEYPKPIISYTENICTCEAYQIAAATDYIIATGSCIIGNIGSSELHINNLNNTEEEKAMLLKISENRYQQLTKDIAIKRHLQMNKIDQWGQGQLFTGQQAYDLKLIDAIGSKTTVINLLKKNIIPSNRKIEWVTIPKHDNVSFFQDHHQEEDEDLDIIEKSILENFVASLVDKINKQ